MPQCVGETHMAEMALVGSKGAGHLRLKIAARTPEIVVLAAVEIILICVDLGPKIIDRFDPMLNNLAATIGCKEVGAKLNVV